MRARQPFDRRLQIKIECCPHGAAQSGILRHDCIHKMRRKARRIAAHDFRWLCKQRLLVGRDDSQISKPGERSRVLALCFLRMAPWIEARWCLRQTSKENCFAQSEIARRLSEIRASSSLRPESPISVATAIQVFRQNALLAPTTF